MLTLATVLIDGDGGARPGCVKDLGKGGVAALGMSAPLPFPLFSPLFFRSLFLPLPLPSLPLSSLSLSLSDPSTRHFTYPTPLPSHPIPSHPLPLHLFPPAAFHNGRKKRHQLTGTTGTGGDPLWLEVAQAGVQGPGSAGGSAPLLKGVTDWQLAEAGLAPPEPVLRYGTGGGAGAGGWAKPGAGAGSSR